MAHTDTPFPDHSTLTMATVSLSPDFFVSLTKEFTLGVPSTRAPQEPFFNFVHVFIVFSLPKKSSTLTQTPRRAFRRVLTGSSVG